MVLTDSYQSCLEIGGGDYPADASFSGRVSVSLADDAETAIVISLVEGKQDSEESGKSVVQRESKSESLLGSTNNLEDNSCQQEMGLSLPVGLKISAADTAESAPTHLNNKIVDTDLGLDLGLSTGPDMPGNRIP